MLDIHGVNTTDCSANDTAKLQVTLSKDVCRLIADTHNYDPCAQPGAVTKLIDGGSNVGGGDDVMKISIKFPKPNVNKLRQKG